MRGSGFINIRILWLSWGIAVDVWLKHTECYTRKPEYLTQNRARLFCTGQVRNQSRIHPVNLQLPILQCCFRRALDLGPKWDLICTNMPWFLFLSLHNLTGCLASCQGQIFSVITQQRLQIHLKLMKVLVMPSSGRTVFPEWQSFFSSTRKCFKMIDKFAVATRVVVIHCTSYFSVRLSALFVSRFGRFNPGYEVACTHWFKSLSTPKVSGYVAHEERRQVSELAAFCRQMAGSSTHPKVLIKLIVSWGQQSTRHAYLRLWTVKGTYWPC
jgi:hypothetical protein